MEIPITKNIAKILEQTQHLDTNEKELLIWAILEKEKEINSLHFQQIKIANKWVLLVEMPENTVTPVKSKRSFGSMKGFVKYMAPDFDEPLDDFKDYM